LIHKKREPVRTHTCAPIERGAAVSLGGVAYAAGLLAWRGGQALGLRILGWVVMVTALAIPSTPTLGLPLVALLVFALAPIPEQVTQDP